MNLYVPILRSQQAKVIPLRACSTMDEWIPAEEAAKLYVSPKKPNGISPLSMKNKVWKKNGKKQLPDGAYTWGPAGLRFHKPTLLGLICVNYQPAA